MTLTLALGIGAATAIFSAVDPILFQPLPYPHAERIALIADRGTNGEPIDVTYGTYRELVERSRSFSSIAIADLWQPALMGLAEPERLLGDYVTARYFQTMGIVPVVGRDFEERDDLPGAPRVVIVSDGFARRHFGSDAAAVGRPIVLDGDDVHDDRGHTARVRQRSPAVGGRMDAASLPAARSFSEPGMGPSPADGGPSRAWRLGRSGAARGSRDRSFAVGGIPASGMGGDDQRPPDRVAAGGGDRGRASGAAGDPCRRRDRHGDRRRERHEPPARPRRAAARRVRDARGARRRARTARPPATHRKRRARRRRRRTRTRRRGGGRAHARGPGARGAASRGRDPPGRDGLCFCRRADHARSASPSVCILHCTARPAIRRSASSQAPGSLVPAATLCAVGWWSPRLRSPSSCSSARR